MDKEKQKAEYVAQRELQRRIVMALLFEEPFVTLVEEVREKETVLWAELRNLLAKNWVVAREKDAAGKFKNTAFHDADNHSAYHYVATQKGLKEFKLR